MQGCGRLPQQGDRENAIHHCGSIQTACASEAKKIGKLRTQIVAFFARFREVAKRFNQCPKTLDFLGLRAAEPSAR